MARQQSPKKSCNLFVLRKFDAPNKLAPTTVDFTPIQKSTNINENIYPVLNKDHKFYTPCFILEVDQKYCENNDSFQKFKFEEKVSNAQEKTLEENNSFPTPTTTCCQICKTCFEDYFRHINQQSHQSLTLNSKGNQLIHQIVDLYGYSNKTKRINKKEIQIKQKESEKQERNLRKNVFQKKKALKQKSNEQWPTQACLQSINNT